MLLTLWIPWDPYILTHYPRAGHSDNAGVCWMAWRTTSYVECTARDDYMMLENISPHHCNSVLALTTFSRGLWKVHKVIVRSLKSYVFLMILKSSKNHHFYDSEWFLGGSKKPSFLPPLALKKCESPWIRTDETRQNLHCLVYLHPPKMMKKWRFFDHFQGVQKSSFFDDYGLRGIYIIHLGKPYGI
jgi:hypothetical protein